MSNPNLESDIAADAMGRLVRAAQELNDAAAAFREDVGLSAQFFTDGTSGFNRVGVRIYGDLIDPAALPTKDGEA